MCVCEHECVHMRLERDHVQEQKNNACPETDIRWLKSIDSLSFSFYSSLTNLILFLFTFSLFLYLYIYGHMAMTKELMLKTLN